MEINGPKAFENLRKATVTIHVPVEGTATTEIQQRELPLANFFAFAKAFYEADLAQITKDMERAKGLPQ